MAWGSQSEKYGHLRGRKAEASANLGALKENPMKRSGLGLLVLLLMMVMSTQAVGGTWTEGQFLYKPGIGARGEQEKSRFDSGLDRVAARLRKTVWLGDPNYGATLAEAVTAIGSAEVNLQVPPGTINIAADLTIPANVTLKPERGAVLSVATGKTLTINGSVEADFRQIFQWTGTGAIVLSGLHPVKTSWFGDSAAGINKALLSVSKPCIFLLPNKTINLGTTSIELYGKGQQLVGQGINFAGETDGTTLTYSGSGYAMVIGKAGVFTSHATLKNFTLNGGGVGAKGLKIGLADPDWIRYPLLENIVVKGFTGNGIESYGSEYGVYNRVQASYNGGAGLVSGIYGGNINRFQSCSFSYNRNEGVLIKGGENLIFADCDMQGNYYEGLKSYCTGSRAINNLTVERCWFEGSQADAGRTDGYYSVWIGDEHHGTVMLRNNSLRGVSNFWNGSAGNKLIYVNGFDAVLEANVYGSVSDGTKVGIEALTRANPCQITWTGHGLNTGDRMAFYGITQAGWIERIGSQEFTVTKIDADTFTVPVDTTVLGADYNAVTDPGVYYKVTHPRPWCYAPASNVTLIQDHADKWKFGVSSRVNGQFSGWHKSHWGYQATTSTAEQTLFQHIIHGGLLTQYTEHVNDALSANNRLIGGGCLSNLKITACGKKTGANGNKTIKLYWGSQVIGTIGPANNTHDWIIEAVVTITDTQTQHIFAKGQEGSSALFTTYTGGTQDTQKEVIVKVTGECADAGDTVRGYLLSITPQ